MGLIASEELCAALRAYQQADMDGVMVLVSREACEKAAIELESMRSVLAALRAFVQLDDDGAITLAPDQAGSYDTDFVLALSNARDLLSRQGIASVPPSARLPVLSAKEVEDIALATFAKVQAMPDHKVTGKTWDHAFANAVLSEAEKRWFAQLESCKARAQEEALVNAYSSGRDDEREAAIAHFEKTARETEDQSPLGKAHWCRAAAAALRNGWHS